MRLWQAHQRRKNAQRGDGAHGGAFEVSLHSRELSGEKEFLLSRGTQKTVEAARRIHVDVSVHNAHSHEFRPFEAGNEAKDTLLLAPAQIGLKAHHVVERPFQIVLAELHCGIGPCAAAGVFQSHGTQGPEAQGVQTAGGQHLHGHAAFKVLRVLFKIAEGRTLCRNEGIIKAQIALFVHGAVDIIAAVFIAVFAVGHGHVHGIQLHHGSDGIVKEKMVLPRHSLQALGQRRRSQRPAGEDAVSLGDVADFLAFQRKQRILRQRVGDELGEFSAVDGQSFARGHGKSKGRLHNQTVQSAQFFL